MILARGAVADRREARGAAADRRTEAVGAEPGAKAGADDGHLPGTQRSTSWCERAADLARLRAEGIAEPA